MIVDFLSAVFHHFYDIMVVNQESPTLPAIDVLKKEDSADISKTTPYKVRFESEPIILGDSANSFIEHSDASDSDKSGAVDETLFSLETVNHDLPPNLIKNPTIGDFISDETSMHAVALFVHYLQYSF